jgi:hypothetical protein
LSGNQIFSNGYVQNKQYPRVSFIGVTHISINGDILWKYIYGKYDFDDFSNNKKDDALNTVNDAWNVVQLQNSDDIIVVGDSKYFEAGDEHYQPTTFSN